MNMAHEIEAKARETLPTAVEGTLKRSYDYGKKTKSHFVGGGTPELPEIEFEADEAVEMKVYTVLNGRQAETWKEFTIRGAPLYDHSISMWTYQLNKDGAEYEGGKRFPEEKLKAVKS